MPLISAVLSCAVTEVFFIRLMALEAYHYSAYTVSNLAFKFISIERQESLLSNRRPASSRAIQHA